jgi:hypothetical protein
MKENAVALPLKSSRDGPKTMARLTPFLLSLPERVLRSTTALAAGLLREIGEVTIPATIRRGQLYENLVNVTLRFLIERVGGVEGVYPGEEQLAEDFLVRRTAGNGIELIGILAFRASPVWVLAALADASGGGRHLIREISGALKEANLLESETEFTTVDQMLDGLEASAGRLASTINTPPLDVKTLRQEWNDLKRDLGKIPPKELPSLEAIRDVWAGMKNEAKRQNRTIYEISAVMALSAVAAIPQKTRWLSASARLAVGKTGSILAGVLLDHYRTTLNDIRKTGYLHYAVRQFRPYLYGAASQFSPNRPTLTEKLLRRKTDARQ